MIRLWAEYSEAQKMPVMVCCVLPSEFCMLARVTGCHQNAVFSQFFLQMRCAPLHACWTQYPTVCCIGAQCVYTGIWEEMDRKPAEFCQ